MLVTLADAALQGVTNTVLRVLAAFAGGLTAAALSSKIRRERELSLPSSLRVRNVCRAGEIAWPLYAWSDATPSS
eukprot:5741720-Lingulodinium_polyedra.AAC.1